MRKGKRKEETKGSFCIPKGRGEALFTHQQRTRPNAAPAPGWPAQTSPSHQGGPATGLWVSGGAGRAGKSVTSTTNTLRFGGANVSNVHSVTVTVQRGTKKRLWPRTQSFWVGGCKGPWPIPSLPAQGALAVAMWGGSEDCTFVSVKTEGLCQVIPRVPLSLTECHHRCPHPPAIRGVGDSPPSTGSSVSAMVSTMKKVL